MATLATLSHVDSPDMCLAICFICHIKEEIERTSYLLDSTANIIKHNMCKPHKSLVLVEHVTWTRLLEKTRDGYESTAEVPFVLFLTTHSLRTYSSVACQYLNQDNAEHVSLVIPVKGVVSVISVTR